MGKREDKFKLYRIIQIEKRIRAGEHPTVKSLMTEHGVSKRTIDRDIEFLRDRYHAPIQNDRKGYYYTDPSFMIQNVLLTEGDLFTVSTVMPLLEQYKNTPLEASFKNIMEKVTQMLPDEVSVDTSFLNQDVSFISDALPKIEDSVFNSIFEAIKLKSVLMFKYRSLSRQDFADKIFDPYHVLCQKGNWYVIGYDHDAKDFRVYALPRMKDISVIDERYIVKDNFELSKAVDLSFGIWYNKEPAVEYELQFSKQVANYISEREWHKDQQLIMNDDGSVTLKFTSNQKQQVLSWVLSFCGKVKVINPIELKNEVIKAAEMMLSQNK